MFQRRFKMSHTTWKGHFFRYFETFYDSILKHLPFTAKLISNISLRIKYYCCGALALIGCALSCVSVATGGLLRRERPCFVQ